MIEVFDTKKGSFYFNTLEEAKQFTVTEQCNNFMILDKPTEMSMEMMNYHNSFKKNQKTS